MTKYSDIADVKFHFNGVEVVDWDSGETVSVTKEDYIKQYMCSFEENPSYIELEDNIRSYYKGSKHLSNKGVLALHKELKAWVKACGFTNKEYNDAKRKVKGERQWD